MKAKRSVAELITALSESLSAEEVQFADIASSLASQLIAKRISLGLTQAEFAEKLGKSQTTVSKWEAGDCNFQIKTLIEISQKLDLPLTVAFKEPVTHVNTYIVTRSSHSLGIASSSYSGTGFPAKNWKLSPEPAFV